MATTRGERFGWSVANLLVFVWALLPVWWIAALSFKAPGEIGTDGGALWPTHGSLRNYAGIFQSSEFTRALVNSLGIATISTAAAILIAAPAAYALARLRFPGKRLLLLVSLGVAMFPQISLVTPLFDIERQIGIFDSWIGLIVPHMTFALPLAIYVLSTTFAEIPWELEQAARMDGATTLQAFRRIMVPLAAPGVFTAAILVFIVSWNDFLFAMSLTSTERARTVPAAIAFFTGSSNFEQPIGSIAAAAVVVTIPVVGFVLLFQRRIVAGLTSGAVKG